MQDFRKLNLKKGVQKKGFNFPYIYRLIDINQPDGSHVKHGPKGAEL